MTKRREHVKHAVIRISVEKYLRVSNGVKGNEKRMERPSPVF